MGRTISIFIFRALAPAVILDGWVASHSSHQDAKRKVCPILSGDTSTHARLVMFFHFTLFAKWTHAHDQHTLSLTFSHAWGGGKRRAQRH